MTDVPETEEKGFATQSPMASLWRSLTVRLVLLVTIFVAVPLILYTRFQAADYEKQQLLLQAVRDKGLLIARALEPTLARADAIPYFRLGEELARFASGPVSLKLLLRPAATAPDALGFFYIASAPPVPTDALDIERRRLIDDGTLFRLVQSCAGDVPLSLMVDLPGGRTELLTSITPVRTSGGCWALVVSYRLADVVELSVGRPYWRSPEVQVAGAIYLVLAALSIGLFFGLWRSLRRFGRMARAIRAEGHAPRFAERSTIPELREVADEFDRMVETLRASASNIRRAAEDTAHAFKTPVGIVRQSLEPIRARLDPADARAIRAVAAIESALEKLDQLIAAARRLDQATADLLDPPRERVDLSRLCRGVIEGYAQTRSSGGARVTGDIAPDVIVVGGDDMIETVIENLVDNALSFSPPAGEIRLALRRGGSAAIVTVDDQGPGVPGDRLERIFERYYSERPDSRASDGAGPSGGNAHFGVGL